MKTRAILAAVLTAGLAFGLSGAEAAPKVLDGKKVKTISFTAVAPAGANDASAVLNDNTDVERVECKPPLCAYLDFTYKPAKGVKAVGLAFESSWSSPVVSDIDLYIAELDKTGYPTDIGHCGASVGNRERVYLPASNFKAGKTYRMISYFYRSAGETVTTKVTFNGPNAIPTTAPSDVDSLVYINCGL